MKKYIALFFILSIPLFSQTIPDSAKQFRSARVKTGPPFVHRAYLQDTIYYDVPRWNSIRRAAIGINPVGPVAAPTQNPTTGALLFDRTVDNACIIMYEIPEEALVPYDSVYIHLHWNKTTNAAGNVDWTLSYHWHDIDTVDGSESSELPLSEATNIGSTMKHMVSSIGIPNTHASGTILHVTIYRRGTTDTYNSEVDLMFIDLMYPLDKPGLASPSPLE